MRAFRTLTRLGLAVAAALTTAVAVAGPAQAATAWDAAGLCGSAYHPLEQQSLDLATVYLSYDGTNDCVVTWLNPAQEGTPTWLGAAITVEETTTDVNWYSHYAGPVRAYAPGACIQWAGKATTVEDYSDLSGDMFAPSPVSWVSPWGHCG